MCSNNIELNFFIYITCEQPRKYGILKPVDVSSNMKLHNSFNTQKSITETQDEIKTGLVNICDCDNADFDKEQNNHTILFGKNLKKNDFEKWNQHYVKLPCYKIDSDNWERWKRIENALNNLATNFIINPNSKSIEDAIKSYNQNSENWNFGVLHELFNELNRPEWLNFFEIKELIVEISKLALQLPNLIRAPIPLLKDSMNHSISLTQQQCACLLANAFFCTFPLRNQDEKSEYQTFPPINFRNLFAKLDKKKKVNRIKHEKLKFILNYFRRVTNSMPDGYVTFTRRFIKNTPDYAQSDKPLVNVTLKNQGCIEDCDDAIQVDFANEFIGGGVLNFGCVQEEIRFLLSPEAIISMLVCEKMNDNECIIIKGIERFNNYKGYGLKLQWDSNYEDLTPLDNFNRRRTKLVAINALDFQERNNDQYQEKCIKRELNKSYCGFMIPNSPHKCLAIATGNWGCGVFEGDPQLKFLIQLLSASIAQRDLIYYTFNDDKLESILKEMMLLLKNSSVTCGELYKHLIKYSVHAYKNNNRSSIHDFLHKNIMKK